MDRMTATQNRKKRAKSYAMDEYLIERIATLSETGKFGNQSTIVSLAVTEFLLRNEKTITEQYQMDLEEQITEFLSSPKGRALIKSIISDPLVEKKRKPGKAHTIVDNE